MSETLEALERQLDDRDPAARRDALNRLAAMLRAGEAAAAPEHDAFNMHCHSTFSFNGYGYSPSGLVARGRLRGLSAMGLVDFDVLDGVAEFLDACALLGMRGGAGLETRVYVPSFSERVITSPGEPGITYHMGMGFVAGRPVAEAACLAGLKETAQRRTRQLVGRVDTLLDDIALDYDAEVIPLTPAGNATERHVCAAYYDKAAAVFPDRDRRAAWWAGKLGMTVEQVEKSLDDPPAFHGVIRAKTMKAGGVGYVCEKGEAFPLGADINRFTLANGAIPTMTWLDGTSDGEQCIDELLDLMTAEGVAAVNIIPDRNWNLSDPEVRRVKVGHFHAFAENARRRNLPVFVGTEMNAYGQKFVDDFNAPEMAPLHGLFLEGALVLHGHTALEAAAGMGFVSEWARHHLPDAGARKAFYAEAGRRARPGAPVRGLRPEADPAEALRLLS